MNKISAILLVLVLIFFQVIVHDKKDYYALLGVSRNVSDGDKEGISQEEKFKEFAQGLIN